MKNLYTLLLLCCTSIGLKAQTAASYTFSQDNGTYTDLSGATNIYTSGWDDNVTNGLSIGFTFNQCGTNYTTFNICANGWINFGSSVSNTYTPLSSKTHVITPLGGDIYRSTSGTVTYLTSGTAPNRVCTIQWKNVCHYSSSSTGPLNFQIILHETTNIIELMYGNFSPTSSSTYNYQVGINGASTSDFNNRQTTSNWAATTAGTSNSNYCRQNNSIKPSSGLIFRWCPAAPAISGPSSVCPGSTITLTDASAGGTWTSSNTALATVGSSTGIVTGVSSGTLTITYTPDCGAIATKSIVVSSLPATPSGSSTVCAGTTTTLTNSSGSGTWVSSNTTVATVGSATGVVTGVASGVSNIIFTLSSTGCSSSKMLTTNPLPAAISGSPNACVGLSTILSDGTSGGTWSSGSTSIATVGSSTGVVAGVTTGTASISYTIPTGCFRTIPVTVNALPATISGSSTVCGDLTTPLTDGTTGGVWSSSSIANASVDSFSGVVTGGSAGSAVISYTLPTGCYITHTMSVHPFSAITGTPSVCIGYSTTLSDATTGGTWSSSDPGVATVSGGTVTSVSLGTTDISYSISSTGCTDVVNVAVTNPPSAIALTGGGAYCDGGTGVHVGLVSSESGIIYQLYNGATSVGGPEIGTGGSIDFGLQTSGGIYGVVANPGTACASTMPATVYVTVNPLPSSHAVSGGGSYCVGGTGVHVYLSLSNTGISYQLYNGATAMGGAMPGTSGAIDFGLQTGTGTYTVEGTDDTTGCVNSMTGSATVSTNPLPVAFSVTGGGGYCAGGSGVHVGLSGSVSGMSYQLLLGGSISGSAVTGTGSSLDFGVKTTAGVYTVMATNTATGCTASMTGSATVVINPLPTVFTVTGGGNYCSGGTGVHIGLNGSTSGVNYQLYRGAALVGSAVAGTGLPIDFGLQTVAGTYTVSALNAGTGCANTMYGSVDVGINPLPVVYSVTGGGSYCAGGTGVLVGLSGSVAGTNYSLYVGSTLAGAASGTGAAIDFGYKTVAGTYTVVATIVATGCTRTMSGSVSVGINALPTSTYTVTGGGNYCAGGTGVTLGLSGSQSGVSYTLYEGGTLSGTAVSGTGSSISFGARTAAGIYTVIGTRTSTMCTSNMTGSKTVVIDPLPAAYFITGGGNYCAGGPGVHIGLSGTAAGISYQLYNGSTATGSPVAGTGFSIDFGLQTAAGTYTVVATNTTTSCTNNMGGSVTVSINSLPVTYTVTGGGNYCSGGTGVHIGLNNSTVGTDYQLFYGSVPSGSAISGSGSAIDFGLKTMAGAYTVVATMPVTGCSNVMAGTANVVINTLPPVHFVTGGGHYCAGGAGVHVGLGSSNTGVSYQLYNGTIAMGTPVAGTGYAISFGLQTTAGTYTVVATNTTTTCTRNMTGSATVVINPLPAVFSVTGGGGYCAGGSGVHINLAGSSSGISYRLFRGGVYTGIYTGSTLTGTGSGLDFGLHTISGSYSVLATNTGSGCSVPMSGSATLTSHSLPAPHHVTGGGSYCAGGAGVHITLAGSNTGVNYQLYNSTLAVGSALPGTGGALDFGLYTATGTYHVVATSPSTTCSANMLGSAAVAVNIPPVVYSVTGGGNYCVGGDGVHVGLSGSNTGITYRLYNGTTLVGSPMAGTGTPLDFGLQTASGSYTITATNATTGCAANMGGGATVGTSPLPAAFTVTGGGAYCAGGAGVHIGLAGSDIGTDYMLYNGVTPVGVAVSGTGAPIDLGSQTGAGTYVVVATTTGSSCSDNMTGSATISINSLPDLHSITGGGSYCAGGTGMSLGLDNSDIGINYQLFNGSGPVGGVIAGTGSSLDMGMQTIPGSYSITASDATTGCSAPMAGVSTIAVSPLPPAYLVTGGGAYCSGSGGIVVGLSGSDAGISYQLFNGASATGIPVSGTGSGVDFGMQTDAGIYTIVATNTTSGCISNMTGSTAVAINTLPATYVVTGGGNICSGTMAGVNVGLSGSQFGITYKLYLSGMPTGALLIGTGGALDFGPQTSGGSYSAVATDVSTGCNSNMAGTVSVAISALPTAFTTTGGGSYCSGGGGVHISLTGSNPGVLYQLYNGTTLVGGPVSGTGSVLDLGAQTMPGSYTVVATNPVSSCSNNMTGMATVAVNSLPVVYAVTGGGNFCAGTPGVGIGLSGSDNDADYQLYQGTIAIGAAVHGTGFPVDFGTVTAPGTYTVVASNTTTACGNTMGGSATVAINALPAAYVLTGGGEYCAGGSGVHVGISGSSSGIDYQLYNGSTVAGAPVAGTGGSMDFGLQTASGAYSVVATNSATGCSRTMTGSSSVVANALPVAYAVTGGGSYCAGGSGVHIGLGSSASGVQYQLYRSSSAAGAPVHGTGAAIDFGTMTLAGTYSVIAINTVTSCGNNMSGDVSVAITPVVSTSVSITTTADDTICAGTTSVFTAVSVNEGVTPSYHWTVNGIARGSGSSLSYIPAAGDIVSVSMSSSLACPVPAVASSSKTLTVFENQAPVVNVSVNPGASVCQGTTVTYSASPYGGGPAPAYSWMKNGAPVSTAATYSYMPAEGDMVYCVMTSNYHCRTANTATSANINMHVTIPVNPTVQITAHPGLSISAGQAATFSASVVNGGPTPGFQWFINGNLVPGATTPVFVTNDLVNGDIVSCDVVSSGPCSGLQGTNSATVHVYGVGVNDVSGSASDIRLVPNPNNGIFTLSGTLGSITDKDVVVEVTDLLGHIVYKDNIPVLNGKVERTIQLNGISNGMYLLNLRSSAENKVFHIVVEQ